MAVVEDREAVLKGNEERRRRTPVSACRQGVVVRAGPDLEGYPFQREPIADARAPKLLLLQPLVHQPPTERSGRNDHCPRLRGDFEGIAHVVVVGIWYED